MKRAREEGQEIIVLSLRERRRSHKMDWLWTGYNRPTAIAPEGRRGCRQVQVDGRFRSFEKMRGMPFSLCLCSQNR